MIDYYEPKLDLTLLGCGFLGECLPGFFGGFRGAPEHRWRARRLGAAVGGDGRFVGVRERERVGESVAGDDSGQNKRNLALHTKWAPLHHMDKHGLESNLDARCPFI